MARNPLFTPVKTPKGWMISVPPAMSADGKRERKFFPDQKQADKFAGSMRTKFRVGQRGGLISHELAIQAAEAARILEPHKISLVEAANEVAARIVAAGVSESFSVRHARVVAASEMRWRPAYLSNMERLPRYLPGWFLEMRCNTINSEVIERALEGMARSSKDLRASHISAIINYRERHFRAATIAIMTPAECGRMLRACESTAEKYAVALLLFAGIRPSAEDGEISRLDWSAVGSSEIYVAQSVAKTNSDRHIPITPRLARLLRGHPTSGTVVPANWRRVYQRLRKAAGISDKQDITRHTFASNFLAAFGEDAAKSAMGHTAGSSTLFRNYRRAVTMEAGKRFFR